LTLAHVQCINTYISREYSPNKHKQKQTSKTSKKLRKNFMGRYEYEQEMRRRQYNYERARREAMAQERDMVFRAEMQRRKHMEQEHRRRMAMQQHNQQMQQRYGPPRDAVDDGCCGCCMM
jgi:hypothetical protein